MQFYFQRHDYDPSMLHFCRSKFLKILLKIHAKQFGNRSEIFYFFDDLWKKEYLFFLTFNDNLLRLNQITYIRQFFIHFSNNMLMPLCEKRFMSSPNMIGLSTFEKWCKSFIYNRINKGPKMDPWGTPHVTAAFVVGLYSKEINCFQYFK